MRKTFSRLLVEAAQEDDRLLLLTGDHGYALFDEFRSHCSDRFLNCGVAEQNMVGVAAGLAKGGFHPLVYGLSSFVPMRVLEQIKMDVCYESLPVTFIGDGAGLVYGTLGASHQCAEDVAALRAVPNIDIHSPADRFELDYCFRALRQSGRPGYLRFGKADCGDVHRSRPDAPVGDLLPIRRGASPVAIVATGSMVSRAIAASSSFDVSIWSVPSITPLNTEMLAAICADFQQILTIEEHSVQGGVGSLVAEVMSEAGSRARLTRMGIRGRFSELCGGWEYLLSYHGLGTKDIEAQLAKLLARG